MCTGKTDIPKAQQLQAAQSPVYVDETAEDQARNRGRRGTILAGTNAATTTMTPAAPAAGKTLLGQ